MKIAQIEFFFFSPLLNRFEGWMMSNFALTLWVIQNNMTLISIHNKFLLAVKLSRRVVKLDARKKSVIAFYIFIRKLNVSFFKKLSYCTHTTELRFIRVK